MRKFTYYVLSLFLFAGTLLCLERRAYAYVDPGSSLILYQGASSMVLGVIYYFRKRLKALMHGSKVSVERTGR